MKRLLSWKSPQEVFVCCIIWRQSYSYTCVIINPVSVTSAKRGGLAWLLLSSSEIKAWRAAHRALFNRRLSHSSPRANPRSRGTRRLIFSSDTAQAPATGKTEEEPGRHGQVKRSFLTWCWATERRTEPGRPSQRPSILWGIWVSVCALAPEMCMYQS